MLLTRSFSSLEYLKLDDLNLNDKGDILYLVRVLESAPSLIELVIKQVSMKTYASYLVSYSCILTL